MAGTPSSLSSSASATPIQKFTFPTQHTTSRPSLEGDNSRPALAANRSHSNLASSFAPRASSLVPTSTAGSFSSDLRSQNAVSRVASRMELNSSNLERLEEDDGIQSEQRLTTLKESLSRELKIKEGSENLLEALNSKKHKQTKEQRIKVEAELNSSHQRIKALKIQIFELQKPKLQPSTPTRQRMAGLFHGNGLRSPTSAEKRSISESIVDEPTESPTFALAEILQALDIDGLTPDYYVEHANNLVELFKRHPTLKYDLVWSIFGPRMQVMLLSESREVVAAGYRMIRHAISDMGSLQKIRGFNTDYLVILSLIKERKADVEREQALKLVRAFLDVKNGVDQLSPGIIRTIVSIAESDGDDRLRCICIETLAEIMIRNPALFSTSGGMKPVTDALEDTTYEASEGLTLSFLYLLDTPLRRRYLRSGNSLDMLFTAFTDIEYVREKVLKEKLHAISTALRTWPGLMTLSMYDFRAIRSLLDTLLLSNSASREVIVDALFTLLRIKPPSWSASFLAGRRLTTYGRVMNLKNVTPAKIAVSISEDEPGEDSLVEQFTALTLAVLLHCGMMTALLHVIRDTENSMIKRKATLLIGEVLKHANRLLPSSWSTDLQLLPELFSAASDFQSSARHNATATVYQIDSVSRTLYRSSPAAAVATTDAHDSSATSARFETVSSATTPVCDEATCREKMVNSGVLSERNYLKWNWDIILEIIEGPLLNGKRLDEAIKASKFIRRFTKFYRPFRHKFADIRNTKPNQKYVKVGCALIKTLLSTNEGVKYLEDDKLLRQVAECLAQCDHSSGLTAQVPMFSPIRLADSLCSGYFAMIGTLSSHPKGLQMLDRWRMVNMIYHIIDLKQRPDLIKLLLTNFDYRLNGHPRILLSKALTGGAKDVRIHATNVLSRYSSRAPQRQSVEDAKWAIQLLVTQLYDPDVEVCAVAIKILEEACNRKHYLEYIVECRPALDHLGEIGAPLLLRFLSTSIGYQYLDGLDYISNEMDDWFLGRNDTYVGTIEAVLARAFLDSPDDTAASLLASDDDMDIEKAENDARIPSHFYKELARTREGCKLLHDKGHFEEFATTVRDCAMDTEDADILLKVKGCMWAIGNVGSMEMGAPFLEGSDVVERIVNIAETHGVMSMRGTAFFVIGLISRSTHGLELLSELGWDSNTNMMGTSLGLCLPTNLGKFLSLQPWIYQKITDEKQAPETEAIIAAAKKDANATNQQIINHVINLGNSVLIPRSLRELTVLKSRKVAGFRSTLLFNKVMVLLSCHHVKLMARRITIDLFDRSVMRRIVLEEEGTDEEIDGDADDNAPSDDEEEESDAESTTERQRSISDASQLNVEST